VSLAAIVGPPLAAPLLFVIGVQWSLIVNAVSFVVSFVMILGIRVPALAGGPACARRQARRVAGARRRSALRRP